MGLRVSWSYFSIHAVLLSCFSLQFLKLLGVGASVVPSNETDRLAFLAFKSEITDDPLGVLGSWNGSVHFCQWHGVTCSSRHQRVTILDLHSFKLVGSMSPHIGNLSFLKELHLQNNSFTHGIPPEIGLLRRLRILNLYNNSIAGEIPANISSCSNLILISLVFNQLMGKIPAELGSLSKLEFIALGVNNLSGSIPSSFGNLSSIDTLSLPRNNLDGSIPDPIGRLKKLLSLQLAGNRLSGTIPSSIFNLSSITTIDVGSNRIQGNLPPDLGITLPRIQMLGIGFNQITGSIPASLSNASNLEAFQAAENKLTGKVPSLEQLHRLSWFIITSNNFGSEKGDDLGFFCSLTNSTRLEVLGINANNFEGLLPECINNLSTTLIMLLLDNNKITGSIPTQIGKFVNIQRLDMWSNQFTGTIPPEIGELQNLGILYLDGNSLSGNIPPSIGNLKMLSQLDLSENFLQGSIPPSLGMCESLAAMDLSYNNLSGTIPSQVIGLSSLSLVLDLSRNRLTGSLPLEVGNLKNLGILDVSGNLLSGEIPSSLGSCIKLEQLGMQGNFLQGPIPSSLSSLRGLRTLDLSQNNLSGEIPELLAGFVLLEHLNLSYNDFEGMVPTGGVFKNATATFIMGNTKLCGGIPEFQLPTCSFSKSKGRGLTLALKLVIAIVSGLLGFVLVLSSLFLFWVRKRRKDSNPSISINSLLKVSYQNLHKATEGFSSENLIGSGSFGSVYKGILDEGRTLIAVKVLNLRHRGASKSFIAECEALRNIRHRNLVKVLTACSGVDYQGNDFKALVYEFMINGSLEEWLHPAVEENEIHDAPRNLNLLQRLNIAIDVACALDYLHHHCQPSIAHCDLKPSNILLDDELNGHVGDFGLARFLPEDSHKQRSSTGVRGSIGYTPPEYGMGHGVSAYGDVYSFGILLLEMFTGKRPTDEMFKDSLNLHNFVKKALPDRAQEIVDFSLLQEEELEEINIKTISSKSSKQNSKILECLISILEIGVACSAEFPRERMRINYVESELRLIKGKLLGTHTHEDIHSVTMHPY